MEGKAGEALKGQLRGAEGSELKVGDESRTFFPGDLSPNNKPFLEEYDYTFKMIIGHL